jgi:tRNA(fMet)-specific endonuclease VapC
VVRFLLDTNVISEAVRPEPDPHVLARLADTEGGAAIAAITWHELRYGVQRLRPSHRREALAVFVRSLSARYPVLPYDRQAAEWPARERARLEQAGLQRSFADGQVAAVAATQRLVLVTRNLRDFEGFAGVDVETWWGEDRSR